MDKHKLIQQIQLYSCFKRINTPKIQVHTGVPQVVIQLSIISNSWYRIRGLQIVFNQLDQRPYKFAYLYLISELNWNSLFIWGGGTDMTGSGAIFSFVIAIQHIL
ncbi:Hypothetical_protein [Hexamita inflata]|uniref:Hypothetical_protein n=1 Tax=Hexamita inflata TaxID=28002 RepID=A0AA86U7M2_9EUKA|nr:Hypothetical protein HINF_LOCUS29851 [Hexamita inflata]